MQSPDQLVAGCRTGDMAGRGEDFCMLFNSATPPWGHVTHFSSLKEEVSDSPFVF